MKLYIVCNARVPTKKAYGIQLAQTCEAFIELGVDVTLLIPRTAVSKTGPSLREFYKLRVDIPTVKLIGLDWYSKGRFAYMLSSLVFMVSSFLYLFFKRINKEVDAIYTFDMDTFSFALLPFVGVPCFSEMHAVKPNTLPCRLFFRRVTGIVTLNPEVKSQLMLVFGVPLGRFIIEPCGVEASWLSSQLTREEARKTLSLPQDASIAAYVGRFYDWKGLDILPATFARVPTTQCYVVGGSREEFQRVTHIQNIPTNMHLVGECASYEVPTWLAAADVLLVPWPKKQSTFHQYRSPMKIYEYMALRKPVVAANDPTITDLIPEGNALLYRPGDASDMANKIEQAIKGGPEIEQMISQAHKTAKIHTLANRGVRIKEFIEDTIQK